MCIRTSFLACVGLRVMRTLLLKIGKCDKEDLRVMRTLLLKIGKCDKEDMQIAMQIHCGDKWHKSSSINYK